MTEESTIHLDPDVMARRKRTIRRLVLYLLLMTAAAGGLGYYAYKLREELAAQGRAGATSASDAELEKHVIRIGTLESELDACRAERAALLKEQQTPGSTAAPAAASAAQGDPAEATGAVREDAAAKRAEELRALFASPHITVDTEAGQALVRIFDEPLFADGSTELTREGELLLMELSLVLRRFPGQRFLVAGHTSGEKPASDAIKDDWELSLARALAVTRFLIETKVRPENLVVAGHGDNAPLAPGKAPKGHERQSRIEVLFLPAAERQRP